MDDMASHVRDALARVKFKPGSMGATLQFFADFMTELRRDHLSNEMISYVCVLRVAPLYSRVYMDEN